MTVINIQKFSKESVIMHHWGLQMDVQRVYFLDEAHGVIIQQAHF